MNSNELKDQRIGKLRGVLSALHSTIKENMPGYQHLAREIERALKEDARLGELEKHPTGENINELAASHRQVATELLLKLVGIDSSPGKAHFEVARDFVDEIVAAAGYEAEARARLRGQ